MIALKNVLVATDFSECSQAAVAQARALAETSRDSRAAVAAPQVQAQDWTKSMVMPDWLSPGREGFLTKAQSTLVAERIFAMQRGRSYALLDYAQHASHRELLFAVVSAGSLPGAVARQRTRRWSSTDGGRDLSSSTAPRATPYGKAPALPPRSKRRRLTDHHGKAHRRSIPRVK